jgi:hypothetical protein
MGMTMPPLRVRAVPVRVHVPLVIVSVPVVRHLLVRSSPPHAIFHRP